jgi:hypothetical protein
MSKNDPLYGNKKEVTVSYGKLDIPFFKRGVVGSRKKFKRNPTHNSSSAFTGSFPKRSWAGFSSSSFTLTKKLTDSRPSIMRWS